MCISYFIDHSKDDRYMASITRELDRSRLAQHMREKLGRPVTTYGRAKPGDIVPVIAPDKKTGVGKVFPMVWGFTGQTQDTSSADHRSRTIISSARSEDAKKSRIFGDSWARSRCLIPASWYYEWEHLRPSTDPTASGMNGSQIREGNTESSTGKADPGSPSSSWAACGNKYMLQPSGKVNLLMAGLYRIETERDGSRFPHFVILTRPAVEDIRFIHDRMPVIIDPFFAEPDFFISEEGVDRIDPAGEGRKKAGSGEKSGRTARQKDYDAIIDTGLGAEKIPDPSPMETSPYYWSGNTGRSAARDWISPGTGSWRLEEIIKKSITGLVYEKC